MSEVVVNTNVTLDGVMQAPAGPDEDTRGGFVHGGWARPYFDQVMAEQAVAITTGGGDRDLPPRPNRRWARPPRLAVGDRLAGRTRVGP